MDMYAENILDHYKNPRRSGKIKNATVTVKKSNPMCGDRVEVQLKIGKNGVIEDAGFTGEGCAISTAGISMFMEQIVGKNASDVLEISYEDFCESMGISLSSARAKCALLGFFAVKKALENF
jgi:nitrogen fixation NifU-like protein